MIPVSLTSIKTRDGIRLDGIVVEPKPKSKTALIWIHGLTSYFYSSPDLVKELSARCRQNGIGYFKFNTRGHDVVVRGQGKHKLLGTVYEKFEDCAHDISAMIRHAKRMGYAKIVLAGHSTGANKAAYYLYKTRDRSVKGVILLGAVNDIAAERNRVGKTEFQKTVGLAQKLYKRNPLALFTSRGYIFTARRALNLFTPGAAEDVFPYYNPKAAWKELKTVRPPLAVIFGSRAETLDRPAKNLIGIFRAHAAWTKSFSGIIIKGADHSFVKKEKELSRAIIRWIKSNGL